MFRTRHVLFGLLLAVGAYLVIDHGQHLVPYLPFTFLLGCLVMHLFMMQGMHGGHGNGKSHDHGSASK